MNGRSGSGLIYPTDAMNRIVGIHTRSQVTTTSPATGGTMKTWGESAIN